MAGAQLEDPRRSARLEQMTQAMMERPGVSLPRMMGGEAALEAAYRFLGNEQIMPSDILAPHVVATAERITAAGGAYCIRLKARGSQRAADSKSATRRAEKLSFEMPPPSGGGASHNTEREPAAFTRGSDLISALRAS